jgi:Ca2+-binding RTX toxin-like protein
VVGNAKGGNDVLTGDAGADEFYFAGAFGRDMVTDFSGLGGEGDTLVFAGYTAADLDIDRHFAMTVITVGENQVKLLGALLTPADIVFV